MRKKENINNVCNDDKTEEPSIVATVQEAVQILENDRISIAQLQWN